MNYHALNLIHPSYCGIIMPKNINFEVASRFKTNLSLDLYQITWNFTKQVPKGQVTTYGAIARALGDPRASRAVGVMEHVNPTPIIVPCHRVVYSNGELGGFGAPEGVEKKIQLLKEEGISVKDGKILDFEDILFTDFKLPGKPPLELLREEQQRLRKKIQLKDIAPAQNFRTIAGIDVSYDYDSAFGAAVVLELNTLKTVESVSIRYKSKFPYIPTYLSYHELPIGIQLLNELKRRPDVVLFDGNGILHPYGLGLATHAGIVLNIPTLGIAKKLLCGEIQKQSNENGLISDVFLDNRSVGYALKIKSNVKPVFVSPGNLMSFRTALELTKIICKTRIPEPIKLAHKHVLGKRKAVME